MRIFAQTESLRLDLVAFLRATRSYFDASLEVRSQRTPVLGDQERDEAELFLQSERHGYAGVFRLRSRHTADSDRADAVLAEEQGRAAGMAGLAARCPTIWELEPVGADSVPARLNLCAILASVALGPVLPDDHSSLFGVRGSMERVERWLRENP